MKTKIQNAKMFNIKKKIFVFLTFILAGQILVVGGIGADDHPEKIVVIKGAITAGTDDDLSAFLAAHLADEVKTIDVMLKKKKIGMTQEEIPAFLIKSVLHQGHTNCLVKRIDTGKYFWTYKKCIYHASGKITGERIFSPKENQ